MCPSQLSRVCSDGQPQCLPLNCSRDDRWAPELLHRPSVDRIRTGEPLPRTWGRSDGEEAEQNWAPLLLLDPGMAISPTGPQGEVGARGEIAVM